MSVVCFAEKYVRLNFEQCAQNMVEYAPVEKSERTGAEMNAREDLVSIELRIRFPHRLEPPVPREVEMVVGVFKRSGKGTFPQRPMRRLITDSTLPPRSVLCILDRIL